MMLPACAVLALLAASPAGAPAPAAQTYRAQEAAWRVERERKLKAEGGWLSVAGLSWLSEGMNSVGAARESAVALPDGSAPAHAGVLEVSGGKVTARLEPGGAATLGGKPVTGPVVLRPDTAGGEPDVLKLGRLSLTIIERNGKLGVRVRDPEAPQRQAFTGLTWFPVDEGFRVVARFEPYDPPKRIPIANVLGQVQDMPSPGALVFTVKGQTLRLDPVLEEPDADQLFVMFRDQTTGKETYGAGRFLYTDMPRDGKVVLDFNRAYSPPCAFTAFATCPLPPPQNRLPVAIPAGEKKPHVLH